MAEQEVLVLLSPQKHQFNKDIQTQTSLCEFQIPVKKFQYHKQTQNQEQLHWKG